MAKTAKKTAKKAAKKSTARRTNKSTAARPAADGYKGHRAGTMKEKLHKLYDQHGDEKGLAMALKLPGVEVSTVRTSFSQFRTAAGKPKRKAVA